MNETSLFLELDSTYRNRTQYPNPGQFEILISINGKKTPTEAYDPVSFMSPVTYWTSNLLNPLTASSLLNNTNNLVVSSIIVTPFNLVGGTSEGKKFVITATIGNLQKVNNYYVGLVIRNDVLGESRRITSYTYIGEDYGAVNDRAIVIVDRPFENTFNNGDGLTIYDPTDFSDTTYPQIFVPAGKSGDNAYNGYILYNETLDESRPVTNYDTDTHILSVDTGTSAGGDVTGWSQTDNYSLRKQKPIVTEEGNQLDVGTVTASTTTAIYINNGSSTDDAYNNMFMRLRPVALGSYGDGVDIKPVSEIRRIIDYDGTTKVATVSPAFSVAPGITAYEIELLKISEDNLNPFTFYGNQLGNQQSTCWAVELINVSLPNKILNSGHGRRIAYYPYIYIELENISSRIIPYISSNNPNIGRVMFRCSIRDVSSPINSAFINIDGDRTKQIVQIKPNDNLKLTVRLPNGDIWNTMSSDTTSPEEPDDLLQISAYFKFTKICNNQTSF